MADIAKLTTLLASPHPISGAWNADSALALAQGKTVDMTQNKSSLSGNDLFTSTDATEFAALTDVKKQMWVSWCNSDRDPFNAQNVAFVNYIFGGGSDTLTALGVLRLQAVSLFAKEGVGKISTSDITKARA